MTYSFSANLHFKLAKWCRIFQLVKSVDSSIEHLVSNLIGKSNIPLVEPFYHLELAKDLFESSIGMHKQGKTYRTVKWDMYFLEDDYNDNLSHFCTANERFRMNTGMISDVIEKIDNALKISQMNEIGSYTNLSIDLHGEFKLFRHINDEEFHKGLEKFCLHSKIIWNLKNSKELQELEESLNKGKVLHAKTILEFILKITRAEIWT